MGDTEMEDVLLGLMKISIRWPVSNGRRDSEGFQKQITHMLEFTASKPDSNFILSQSREARASKTVTIPYADLEFIAEREMELGKVHSGRALVCRTISDAVFVACLFVVCVDPAGDTIMLVLNDFTATRFRRDLEQVLPEGSLLLIKEPYFNAVSKQEPFVRCDNVDNLVILQPFDSILSGTPWYRPPPTLATPADASGWRNQGNMQYKRGEYREAIESYSKGLSLNPQDAILLSNRCQARLSIGRPNEALADAESVVAFDSTSVKGHQRRGRALFELGRYREAGKSFHRVATLARAAGEKELNNEAKDWSKKSTRAAKESEDGAYDWASFASKLKDAPHASIECADFMNSDVHIVEIEGKGLGVVAKTALEPGTLVIVEKALAIAWKGEGIRCLTNHNSEVMSTGEIMPSSDEIELGVRFWDKLQQNDYLREKVMTMSRGPFAKNSATDDVSGFDEIRQIVATNKFTTCPPNQTALMRGKKVDPVYGSGDGMGIWELCSRLNHSCVPNCCQGTLGDLTIIRTTRRVEEGEECCLSYLSLDKELEERTQELQQRGFTCDCELCEFQRTLDPNLRLSMRSKVAEWHVRAINKDDACKDGLPELCRNLDVVQTELNLQSVSAHMMAGFYFGTTRNDKQSLYHFSECWKKIKADPRLSDPHTAVDILIQCAARYYCLGDRGAAKQWGKEARDVFALVFGREVALFELGHRDSLRDTPALFKIIAKA